MMIGINIPYGKGFWLKTPLEMIIDSKCPSVRGRISYFGNEMIIDSKPPIKEWWFDSIYPTVRGRNLPNPFRTDDFNQYTLLLAV